MAITETIGDKMVNILVFRGEMVITETNGGKVSNVENYRGENDYFPLLLNR